MTEFSLDPAPGSALDALAELALGLGALNPPNNPAVAAPGGRLAFLVELALEAEAPKANENALDVSSDRCALGFGEGTLPLDTSAGATAAGVGENGEGAGAAWGDDPWLGEEPKLACGDDPNPPRGELPSAA